MLTLLTFTPELKLAIQIAQSIAKEHRNAEYSPAHLLKGILHNDVGTGSLLASWGKNIHFAREWADVHIARYPKSGRPVEQPAGDEQVARLLEVADVVRLKLSEEGISPVCILAAMAKPNVAFTADQLKTFPFSEKELLEKALSGQGSDAIVPPVPDKKGSSNGTANKANEKGALLRFCIDKTELAKEGKIDPIVGRDREVRKMAEILGRRTKPNVIIVGEPGVGKTALVEGFAQRIVDGQAPPHLQSSQVFELDLGALVAGAAYKGEVEERLKGIISEVKQFEKAILFIDEIHVLLDPKGSLAGAANLLKPELARGELTVIGATTFDEYRKYIEKDDAFKRRFDVLEVEEPDADKAERMLKILLARYEEHHEIKVEEEALREAVRLAFRYLKDRRLPDAAIDLVDKTMAAVRMMKSTSAGELTALLSELEELEKTLEEAGQETVLRELRWFDGQIKDRVSPILLGKLQNLKEAQKIEATESLNAYLKEVLAELQTYDVTNKETVTASDIAAMVAYSTGIPLGKLQSDEREKLERLVDHLKKRVVGQDHALETLSNAIGISRAGLSDDRRPIGSFFFLGPTGTGKTELAKAIAEFLFNDERALMRFDMSEYTQSHAVDTLTGAPPGFVGHEEGGVLVNRIREQPYSVVLFDEIEKADPNIFKVFLQILDDGRLSDKLGKEGDFTNAIILFTSNIGSDYVVEKFDAGEIPDQAELVERMGRHFRDEFLGRLTEVIPFAPIKEENIVKILDIQLKKLHGTLSDKGIKLEIGDEAKKHLAMMGFNPRFGARPLRRVVFNEVQKPLAKIIITGKLDSGGTVELKLDEAKKLKFEII
ncbi:MAG: ATP-dependent Clp protease ATP-binding subunit [Saprospiraceae bacterium]|nr:ATP-dependent Clp protease ATP-binding subunit [Saprospiraceae bacterium]